MSAADIADNKWEVEASKPPVSNIGGILQIVVVAFFAAIFAWMMSFTFQGIFGAKRDTMADAYGNLSAEGQAAAEAAPAAE